VLHFIKCIFFTVDRLLASTQPPSEMSNPCQLSATPYLTYT